jgi:GNAT superfamily N-acetyltransferase
MPVRPWEPADLPDCLAVLRRVYEHSDYPARWPADPAGWLGADQLLGAWVAEEDGALAGFVGLKAGAPDPSLLAATGREDGQVAAIVRLFVEPTARRAGWGARLLEAAARWSLARGRLPVLEVVDDAVPAISLYERAGWRLVGTAVASWTMPDGTRPGLRYYVSPAGPAA